MKTRALHTGANVSPQRRTFLKQVLSGLALGLPASSYARVARTTISAHTPYLGEVILAATNIVPAGWNACDGTLLTISSGTAPMFSLLGTSYGGNGSTTFALPDLRRRVAIGRQQGVRELGQTGGAETVTLSAEHLPSHTHALLGGSGRGTSNNPAGRSFAANAEGIAQYATSGASQMPDLGATGEDGAHNNMPPYLSINHLIAVSGNFPSMSSDVGSGITDRYLGEIMLFAGNFAPYGWLKCEGQLLTISEYDSLFSLIGTTYGGDGEESFALPDLRSRIPIAANGSTYMLGATGGEEQHTLTTNELPAHSHAFSASSGLATSTSPAGNVPATNAEGVAHYGTGTDVALAGTAVASAGSSQAHENMPPWRAMTYCIATDSAHPMP